MEKARLDWGNLIFGYTKTDYNVRCYYRNGKWGELEISSSESINLNIASVSLHYGQQAFEGLKIFEGQDGKARVFRLEALWKWSIALCSSAFDRFRRKTWYWTSR